jgi:hypothetical protein
MEPIERYIIENRDRFDLEEPREGHFERFESKRQNIPGKPGSFSLSYLLKAVAVTILFALSSIWIYESLISQANIKTTLTLADISSEYRDAEIYYTALISRKLKEIKSFDFHDNSREQKIVLEELSEMDTIYKSLEKELDAERGNHMVINAMIRHHQLKLDIMSQLLEHLYEFQTAEKSKTENDENITI